MLAVPGRGAAQSCTAPSFGAAASFGVGTNPQSEAIADFNRDGKLDLVTANHGSDDVSVLLGTGGGGFGTATMFSAGVNPNSVAVGDFDGDGKADLAVVNQGGDVTVRLGDGAGGFGPPASFGVGVAPQAVAIGDFNGDGKPDLVTADNGSNSVSILLGTGTGSFGAATSFPVGTQPFDPVNVAVGDFNKDGKADLVVVNDGSDTVSVLLGSGTGSFGAATNFQAGVSSQGLAAADFNQDGNLDVAVTNFGSNSVSVLLGTGAGGFGPTTNFGVGTAPHGIAAGDLDLDGKLDLAVGNFGSGDVSILQGDGNGGFGPATSIVAPGVALVLADLDADGRPDLIGAGFNAGTVSVLLNTFGLPCANASFGPAARSFAAGTTPANVLHADFNRDGIVDVALANLLAQALSVLLGTGSGSFGPPSSFPVPAGNNVEGLATADFNGDGNPDLATANGNSNSVSVLLGTGTGSFGAATDFATGANPQNVVAADFNGDGKLDLATANDNSADVSVLLGNGGGGFGAPISSPVGNNPIALAAGDFNGDGKLDLAVARDLANTITVVLGTGTGAFGPGANFSAGMTPVNVTVADFNNDGELDLAVPNDGSANVSILLGTGTGGFGAPTHFAAGTNPRSVAVSDFNADGNTDIAVGNGGSNDVSILLGTGTGGFGAQTYFPVGAGPYFVDAGDLNADGRPDLATANVGSDDVTVLLGTGTGSFVTAPRYAVGTQPFTVAVGDFNRDGKADLATANSGSASVSVLLGMGTGSFGAAASFTTPATPDSVAIGDFNRDGKADLATANNQPSDNVAVLLGDGSGGFGPATTFATGGRPHTVTVADFNDDGKPDLATANDLAGAESVSVLLGDGAGGFGAALSFPVGGPNTGLVAADFNRDGKVDVAVMRDILTGGTGNWVQVHLGNGDGTFGTGTGFTAGTAPVSAAVGDFNGDGKADLAVVNQGSSDVSILIGTGTGTFEPPTNFPVPTSPDFPPSLVTVGDFNGDGKADLAVGSPASVSVLLGTGTGSFGAATRYGAGGNSLSPAVGDFDADGRADIAAANFDSNDISILLNTNCKDRRLGIATQVSSCNTPGSPFGTQPVLKVVDDGDNVIQCDTGTVGAAIVPGTGTGGATLGGTTSVAAISGIATFTNLSVNLPGRAYRLEFTHPQAAPTRSRTFTQGLTAAISGPPSICTGGSATYDAGPGYDTYNWLLDGNPLSMAQTVTLSGLSPGSHTLQLTVTQDGCTATTSMTITVGDLTAVSIATPGPTAVCGNCFGGVVTVTDTGGGPATHQWGFRTVSGGAITPLAGRTGTTYTIHGADFPGPGTYFLVVTTTPTCGSPMVSNELTVTIGPTVPFHELAHGSNQVQDLSSQAGPVPDLERYRIGQGPRSSYEVVVDATSGDIGAGAGPSLERVAGDEVTVLQASVAIGTGSNRSLRWENTSSASVTDQIIQVRSLSCTTDCGIDDIYRIRAYETTYAIPRFNNAGSQLTVLLLQNPAEYTVNGNIWFWNLAGSLIGSRAFSLGPKQTLVLNTATVAGVAGQGGTITVSNDGRYGDLAGKTVALEPSTGFSFDSPMTPRPRDAP